jgi:DNA-binding NarL/FixJ family response regulator
MSETNIIEGELPARVLVIDSRRTLALRVVPSLADELPMVPVVVDVTAGRPAVDLMRTTAFDAVVADLDAIADLAPALDERISRLARASSGALIIVLSDDAGISISLAAMRAGAHDCIGRPSPVRRSPASSGNSAAVTARAAALPAAPHRPKSCRRPTQRRKFR